MQSQQELQTVEIDFLPEIYRVEGARRRTKAWQVTVVAVFVTAIAAATLVQRHIRRSLEVELDQIALRHDAAQALTTRLAELQNEVKSADSRAELITYLRHPWPRTQVLAALLGPLPKTITLAELRIGRETVARQPTSSERGRPRRTSNEAKQAENLNPVEQDLNQLREQLAGQITVASLAGATDDVSSLHSYLGQVAQHPIIAKAEVRSIEKSGKDANRFEFRARLTVRAGYGTVGGPEPSKPESTSPDQADAVAEGASGRLRPKTGSG